MHRGVISLIGADFPQPFPPDCDEQRHQDWSDEQSEEPHRLHAANQPEEGRKECQLDRASDEFGSQCLVDDEQFRRTPNEQQQSSQWRAATHEIEGDERKA